MAIFVFSVLEIRKTLLNLSRILFHIMIIMLVSNLLIFEYNTLAVLLHSAFSELFALSRYYSL